MLWTFARGAIVPPRKKRVGRKQQQDSRNRASAAEYDVAYFNRKMRQRNR